MKKKYSKYLKMVFDIFWEMQYNFLIKIQVKSSNKFTKQKSK